MSVCYTYTHQNCYYGAIMKCVTLEIFHNNQWHEAANISVQPDLVMSNGYRAPSILMYKAAYATEHLNAYSNASLSVNYPPNYELIKSPQWPPFLLDLLPSGAGRRALLNLHNLPDQQAKSDWFLLNVGASCPPGNMRIQQAVQPELIDKHEGFDKNEIIGRQDDFIEYARSHGAPVAGSTGAQGDAPKYLLTRDHHGKWHADGALSDKHAQKHYLVKYPRGKTEQDARVLYYESFYHDIARTLGLRVHESVEWINDTLLIPRFDRHVQTDLVERYGLESLCSVAGVAEFGQSIDQLTLCNAFLKHVNEPTIELVEYLKRDICNFAFCNTDNHARNTALIKFSNGMIQLSPLYDFAPMALDPEGIARTCRWQDCENGVNTDWPLIVKTLQRNLTTDVDFAKVTAELHEFHYHLDDILTKLTDYDFDHYFLVKLNDRIKTVINKLKELKHG